MNTSLFDKGRSSIFEDLFEDEEPEDTFEQEQTTFTSAGANGGNGGASSKTYWE